MRKVQYSPESVVEPYFRVVPFAYTPANHDGYILTTVNRVRILLERDFGIEKPSLNLILGIFQDIHGHIPGFAMSSDGNMARICYFHMWSFCRRVEIALKTGEIKKGKAIN